MQTTKKYTVKNGELVFTEPVTFDDIYDYTADIIIEMYPRTEDLIEALSDISYDSVAVDFREWFIELAKEQKMYRE